MNQKEVHQDYREGVKSKEAAFESGFRMGLGVCLDVLEMLSGETDPETKKRKDESEKTGLELSEELGLLTRQRRCFDTRDYYAEPRKEGWHQGTHQGIFLFTGLATQHPYWRASMLIPDFESSIENAKKIPLNTQK